MPVSNETLNRELYDILRSRNYDPVGLDTSGDPTDDTENADVFRFHLEDEETGEKITAWATIEGRYLVLYMDNKLTKHKDFESLSTFLRRWSQRKTLLFKTSNRDRLLGDMKKRAVMQKKEQVLEGYHAMGKKASYNDAIPQVKIVLQHTRQLEEGEQRFRNIAKIFVENLEGERFLLPTNRPGLARVYARHIAEGGTPYDDKGRHITTLVEEYQKMAGFVRATKNGQFNESALALVNEGLKHYNDLRMTLQGLASHRGYNNYFESYTPVLNEESEDDVSLNELFVQETLDPRIESVMPILKRLSKNINEMSAVKELEEWAQSITEVEDETTKTLAEPADEMLEGDIGDPDGTGQRAYDRKQLVDPEMDELERKVLQKAKQQTSLPQKKIKEAPGAMTLKHNQDTEKSNLKAFDLAEGPGDEPVYPDDDADDKRFDDMDEGLDANQKRVGQLGPTEKVGPKGAVGKLVGTSESVELSEMDKSQSSSDRGGESSGDPYAKGGKATPSKAKDVAKDAEKTLNKSMDKAHKKDTNENFEFEAIKRLAGLK